MSLGQRIRHLRQSRGLTQAELGGGPECQWTTTSSSSQTDQMGS